MDLIQWGNDASKFNRCGSLGNAQPADYDWREWAGWPGVERDWAGRGRGTVHHYGLGLQAKPAYWGIVNRDGNGIPGYGLKFELKRLEGLPKVQKLIIVAKNGGVGPEYTTKITGLTLEQWIGKKCSAEVVAPQGGFPVSLGDIPTNATVTAQFTLSFKRCGPEASFLIKAPWTQATYHTGTLLRVENPHFRWVF